LAGARLTAEASVFRRRSPNLKTKFQESWKKKKPEAKDLKRQKKKGNCTGGKKGHPEHLTTGRKDQKVLRRGNGRGYINLYKGGPRRGEKNIHNVRGTIIRREWGRKRDGGDRTENRHVGRQVSRGSQSGKKVFQGEKRSGKREEATCQL